MFSERPNVLLKGCAFTPADIRPACTTTVAAVIQKVYTTHVIKCESHQANINICSIHKYIDCLTKLITLGLLFELLVKREGVFGLLRLPK